MVSHARPNQPGINRVVPTVVSTASRVALTLTRLAGRPHTCTMTIFPDPPMPEPADDCIFCRIIRGELPCHRLYEDNRVLSFLDIGPISHGHCLIIPKAHVERFDQLDAAASGACLAVVPRLSAAVMSATGALSWNLLQNNGAEAGQVVPHVHFHIVPNVDGRRLRFEWKPGQLDADAGKDLAAKITHTLNHT